MQITRRRFIGITAAVSAASLLPSGAAQGKTTEPVVWQGVALGGCGAAPVSPESCDG